MARCSKAGLDLHGPQGLLNRRLVHPVRQEKGYLALGVRIAAGKHRLHGTVARRPLGQSAALCRGQKRRRRRDSGAVAAVGQVLGAAQQGRQLGLFVFLVHGFSFPFQPSC